MAASDRRGQDEDGIKRFDPRILDRSVIAIPLLEEINKDDHKVRSVIIDVNLDYAEGRDAGRKWIREAIKNAVAKIAADDEEQGVREKKTDLSNQYIFARLSGKVIREVVRLDVEHAASEARTARKAQRSKKGEKPQCNLARQRCTAFAPFIGSGPISRFRRALPSRWPQ